MFFVGIDIGKSNHEVALIDSEGKAVGSTLRFANSRAGSGKLLDFIAKHQLLPQNTLVGMEATGHYWQSIYSFLVQTGFHVTAFNPIQSDRLRDFYIRKTKTDRVDAVLIAQVIRLGLPAETELPKEDIFRLKQLERFRYYLVDRISDLKRKVIACLDQIFPEYDSIFSDIFGRSSMQILLETPLPAELQEIDVKDLKEKIHLASGKRFGLSRASVKADKLQEAALTSFGIHYGNDVFKLEIQFMLQQIQLLERQVRQLEDKMSEIVRRQDNFLTTITGVGEVTAAVLLGEIGDIYRFKRSNQLLAFAGLDASVYQSGNFTGTQNSLSKRGSPYLRRAIWQAAFIASQHDPALSVYYQSLRDRGKSHGTALGAVARKMVNIIFAVWTQNKPYEARGKVN